MFGVQAGIMLCQGLVEIGIQLWDGLPEDGVYIVQTGADFIGHGRPDGARSIGQPQRGDFSPQRG